MNVRSKPTAKSTQQLDRVQANEQEPRSKADFHRLGISIAEWSQARGFSQHLVYSVLSGNRKCLRGQSYKIAKELGMK